MLKATSKTITQLVLHFPSRKKPASFAMSANPKSTHSPLIFLLLISCFHQLKLCSAESSSSIYEQDEQLSWLDDNEQVQSVQSPHASLRKCNLTYGKWVNDESYPLYDSISCPYLSSAVTCKKNGRPDSDYEKWSWKPDACTIPRFDALEFLGKMRRKRIMLIGDSIMRNQWESLVCLVQSVIPTAKKTVTYHGPVMEFQALDFETSIEFCWAPFLVELRKAPRSKRILHLDLIEENAKYWRGVDVLVFDSAHWWTHSDKWSSWDFIMEGNNVFTTMDPMKAYEKGLTTWSKWIDLNVDPSLTRVFFRSMSPRHNRENGWNCYNQKEPLENLTSPHVTQPTVILKGVLRRMSFPVHLMDITAMSALRRDGHPSIYASRASGQDYKQHLKDHSSDCSHWCLPGVPDAWNEILNALI